MRDQVKTMAICVLCNCGLDTTKPHAIVKHDYAHEDCAQRHDSRDLGALPDPADSMGSEWPDIDEEDEHGNH